MPARGERLLAAELIGTEAIVTMRQLANKSVPAPHQYLAALVAYGMLSGLALVGDTQADFAAAVGGLVLLTAMLSFPELFSWLATAAGGTFPTTAGGAAKKGGNKSLIDDALAWEQRFLHPLGNVPLPGPLGDARKWLCEHSPGLFKPIIGC